MSRIKVLPQEVVNQIAAGEVVERPASVVKELVENSLDAGATRIECRIVEGGRELVEVTDDGYGMSPEDLELCLRPHATSKITRMDDLESISSLGFRGEALASIAAVSKLRIVSRERSATAASWIESEGGQVVRKGTTGAPVGTRVEVRQLFFNTPARRKFLRTVQTELGHVQNWFRRLALARPGVRLVLKHGKRQIFDYQATSDPSQRVSAVVGRQVYEHLYPVEWEDEGLRVRGLVSDPYETRPDSGSVHFIVNGRWIKDRVLLQAMAEATRAVLPPGRWPVAVIWLDLEPSTLDVNVHPQKVEVRFHSPMQVRKALVQALSRLWAAAPWLPGTKSYVLGGRKSHPADSAPADKVREAGPARPPMRVFTGSRNQALPFRGRHNDVSPVVEAPDEPERTAGLRIVASRGEEAEALPLHMWNIVGQLWNTYILLSNSEKLVVIDQHAAAERITFQHLLEQSERGDVPSQRLLMPLLVEVEQEHAGTFEQWKDHLYKLGFDVEAFGPATLKLSAVPALLDGAVPEALLKDTLSELSSWESTASWERARDKVLSTMACHASVRAGQRLGEQQIQALLEQLESIDYSGTCPHGRPVVVSFTRDQVGSWFSRT